MFVCFLLLLYPILGNSTMMALIEQHRTSRNGDAGNNYSNNNLNITGPSMYGTGKVTILLHFLLSSQ